MLRHRTTAFVCACLAAALGSPAASRARRRRRRRASGRAGRRPRPARWPTPISTAYFERNPDQVTLFGVPGRRHDALPDNSLEALKAWQAREDGWLDEAQADRSGDHRRPRRCAPPTRSSAKRSRASIGARVCRYELWTVSQMNGWQVQDGYLVTIQPVGTDEARQDALARWSRAAEVHRHRDRQSARRAQGRLLRAEGQRPHRHRPDEHADRDADSRNRRSTRRRCATRRRSSRSSSTRWSREQIVPAFTRYRDFLRAGVPAGGARGDRASRPTRTARPATTRPSGYHSSLPMPAREVHATRPARRSSVSTPR